MVDPELLAADKFRKIVAQKKTLKILKLHIFN